MARRRTHWGGLGLAIVTGVLVGACGGISTPQAVPSAARATPIPSIASTAPPTTAPPTAPPSEPRSPSTGMMVDLGAVGYTPRGSRVTVHSFGPSDRAPAPPTGTAWLEADLEWCLPPTLVNPVSLGIIRYELRLELSDGTAIDPEAEAASPDEVYASDGTFKADECVRGPLVFAVPTAVTPDSLLLVGAYGGMRWRLE